MGNAPSESYSSYGQSSQNAQNSSQASTNAQNGQSGQSTQNSSRASDTTYDSNLNNEWANLWTSFQEQNRTSSNNQNNRQYNYQNEFDRLFGNASRNNNSNGSTFGSGMTSEEMMNQFFGNSTTSAGTNTSAGMTPEEIMNQFFGNSNTNTGTNTTSDTFRRAYYGTNNTQPKNDKTKINYKEHVLFNVDIKRQNQCGVCITDFEEGESACILPCWHIFHKECVDPWMKKHNSCPNCRVNNGNEKTNLTKENMQKCKKEHRDNIFFGEGLSVDLTLIDKLSVKNLKALLNEFNVDYKHCVEKTDLRNLVLNEIFYQNKPKTIITGYLKKENVDFSDCIEKNDMLKLVAITKLTKRI